MKPFSALIILVLSLACGALGRAAEPSHPPLPAEKLAETFSDADVFALRAFAEPLVPTSAPGTAQEDAALRGAVNAFLAGGSLEPLDGFLTAWPASRWTAGLEYNLGLHRYLAGYFTRAEADWNRAWELTRGAQEPEVHALADQALAQLVRLQSRLGQTEELRPLLKAAEGRVMRGSARQMIDTARGALYAMENRPGHNSTSPLSALARLRTALGMPEAGAREIAAVPSSPQGISLAQVSDLASGLKMPNRMVRRTKGSDIPVPSIAHFKLGHYAAIVGKSDKGFQVRDAAFGFENTISADAILTEGSGYFLVPTTQVPKGFEAVSSDEGEGIHGSGDAEIPKDGSYRASDLFAVKGPDSRGLGGPGSRGLANYAIHAMLVSLHVEATPLENTMAFGPDVAVQLAYNERDTTQPANLNVTNFGRQWTMNWNACLQVESDNTARVMLRGGGFEDYPTGLAATGYEQADSHARLVRQSATQWARKLPDGSREIYTSQVPPGQNGRGTYWLTQVSDSFGNTVKLEYDSSYRLSGVRDPLGRETTFSYGLQGKAEKYRVTKISDPVGRGASFTYNAAGQLETITSDAGRESKFTYAAGDLLNALETPYGKTTFARGLKGDTRWIEVTDPLGGQQRVEYAGENGSVPASDEKPPANPVTVGDKKVEFLVDNTSLNLRDTFVWDKHQMEVQPRDYAIATVYHWLQGRDDAGVTAPVPSSIQRPLESRVWFNYPEQTSATQEGTSNAASKIARVLDEGETQLCEYGTPDFTSKPNFRDKPTPKPPVPPKPKNIVLPFYFDPIGRETWIVFALGDGKLKSIQARQVVAKNRTSEVLYTNTYDAEDRRVTQTDAAGGTTTYLFNQQGQRTSLTNALQQKTTWTYDGLGRIIAVDPPLAGPLDRITVTYDEKSRRTSITQWGYKLAYSYDDQNQQDRVTYPDGTYELTDYSQTFAGAFRDREGKTTKLIFDANLRLTQVIDPLQRVTLFEFSKGGQLMQLTDPLGHVTKYAYDAAGRVTAKITADDAKTTFSYTSNSLLASVRDAKGQTKQFTYAKDNRLIKITYSGAQVATAPVTWVWDNFYPRITKMTDGVGPSKYTYVKPGVDGAGRVATVDGPFPIDLMAYTYDPLNRIIKRTIHDNDNFVQRTYDALDRVTKAVTNMGAFTYHYNDHGLLDRTSYPNGQAVDYTYFDDKGDFRLQTLAHRLGGTDLLTESYTHSPVGNLLTRQQQGSGEPSATFTYSYDAADQLIRAAAQGGDQEVAKNYPITYSYDAAANLLTTAWPGQTRAFTYNSVNQRMGTSKGAQEFDLNGNLTKSPTFSVKWDAENRPTSIDYGTGRRVEYGYDGYGRRVRIREVQSDVRQAEYRYIWDGLEICEQRNVDAPNLAHSAYFPEGEAKYVKGDYLNLFYVKDWQGSIRKATIATGSVAAKASYLPFGVQPDLPIKTPAETDADFGYTGLFACPVTGLPLTPYRVLGYAAWLSRDPLGELPEMNAYSYVRNNPLAYTDPLGLFPSPDKYLEGTNGFPGYLPRLGDQPRVDLLKQPDAIDEPQGFEFAPWRNGNAVDPEPIILGGHGDLLGGPGSRSFFEKAIRFSPVPLSAAPPF